MNYSGLSELEAQKIYIQNGPNEIPISQKSFFMTSILRTLLEPMIIILLSVCLIYFFIGKIEDFLILSFSALVIFSINIFQNYKSEEAIKKLKSLTKSFTEVIRDGEKKLIDSSYLVEGDYVLINEGDRIPADIIVLESLNLLIDESILTGESLPVVKSNYHESNNKKFLDSHLAFSGTLITSGWLIGVVHKTGTNTKIGKIGKKLILIKDEEPQVKKEINVIVYKLAILCVITCLFVFLYNFYFSKNFVNSLLSSMTLAIALVPEELPIVLTIFLALSSIRLSRIGLIIKNKAIVETLGATNVICVDKTGTITKNELKLKKIIIKNHVYDIENLEISDDVKNIIQTAYNSTYFNSKDTSDLEIINIYKKMDFDYPKMEVIGENIVNKKFVFSKKYLFRKNYLTCIKGAYEQVSKLCRINEKYEDFYLSKIEEMSSIGFRIIAVAKKNEIKETGNKKFELLGLLAFQDEIREDAKEYVEVCQRNNIRVCIITGDYKNTAIYFAKEISLNNYEKVLTGEDLDKLPEDELKRRIQDTNIFARVTPNQKHKIVTLLKSYKNIVAMTGDGVNDVLALKSSNVGISIGLGGSDIAKEASDVILVENSLKSIVSAIVEGRRVYNNLGTTGRYIYSFHIPIILIALFNSLLQLPPLLLPVHIALLEFIIDPFSTLVFESIPGQKNLLATKPRRGSFKLIQNMDVKLGTFYGVLMFLCSFIPFYLLYLNNNDNFINISLLNILGLNIILIWLNFTTSSNFKDYIKNKRFVLSMIILIIVFISGLIYVKTNYFETIIILTCSLLFGIIGSLARDKN